MKQIRKLIEIEKVNLRDIKKRHMKYRERERATGILLSDRGYSS